MFLLDSPTLVALILLSITGGFLMGIGIPCGGRMNAQVRSKVLETVEARNAVFRGLARNRPLTKDYEEVGFLGEWAFGEWSGIFPRTKPGGDGGYDFQVPLVLTVDVKASKKGDFLHVEEGKVKADIYVLAHVTGDEEVEGGAEEVFHSSKVTLVGWAFSTQVRAVAPKDAGRGIISHTIPRELLRPMVELERVMGRFTRGK